jgi:hypothetical protein
VPEEQSVARNATLFINNVCKPYSKVALYLVYLLVYVCIMSMLYNCFVFFPICEYNCGVFCVRVL